MRTIRQLVTRAARMLQIGGNEAMRALPAAMGADGLESAQGMYAGFVANGLFGPATEVLADDDYTANENERVINTSGGSIDVTMPATITECGVTRAPQDRSFVIVTGTSPATVVYDADQAAWVQIETLTLDDNAPFTSRFETGLSALLAVHIAAEYGLPVNAVTAALATSAHAAMRIKRPIVQSVDSALLRLSANARNATDITVLT